MNRLLNSVRREKTCPGLPNRFIQTCSGKRQQQGNRSERGENF